MMRWITSMIALLFVSCGNSTNFVSMLEMPHGTWYSSEYVEFDFLQTDTTSNHKIELILRHQSDFKYNSMLLEVRTVNPLKQYWCDTVNIQLADATGRWLGQDMRNWSDLGVIYRNGVKFSRAGDYNIRLRHLTPRDSLEGIVSVGIIISSTE